MTETAMKTKKAKLLIINRVKDDNGETSCRIPLVPTSRGYMDAPEFVLEDKEKTGNAKKDDYALVHKALNTIGFILDQKNPEIKDAKAKLDYNDDTIIVAVTLSPWEQFTGLNHHVYGMDWFTVDTIRNGGNEDWLIDPELGSELDSVYSTYDAF